MTGWKKWIRPCRNNSIKREIFLYRLKLLSCPRFCPAIYFSCARCPRHTCRQMEKTSLLSRDHAEKSIQSDFSNCTNHCLNYSSPPISRFLWIFRIYYVFVLNCFKALFVYTLSFIVDLNRFLPAWFCLQIRENITGCAEIS